MMRTELPARMVMELFEKETFQKFPYKTRLIGFSVLMIVPISLVLAGVLTLFALGKREFDVLLWLLIGHCPAIVLEYFHFKTERPPLKVPKEHDLSAIPTRLIAEGVYCQSGRILRWSDFIGFQYEREEEGAYRIRLDQVSPEQERVRMPYPFWRHFATAIPTVVTVIACITGYLRFGMRMDVLVALCLLPAHYAVQRVRWSNLYKAKTARRARNINLLFDSHEVPASEALAFLAYHVPGTA